MIKKITGIVFTAMLPCLLSAQVRLTVKSPDSLAFVLYIEEARVNNLPCVGITLDNLEAVKTNLKAVIPSRPEIAISQQLPFKKNTSVFYDIEFSKGAYRFVLKSESTNLSSPLKPVLTVSDTLALPDSTAIITDTNPCGKLAGADIFQGHISELEEIPFEAAKLEKMKNFTASYCLKVAQLKELMALLAMEERKLELLRSAVNSIDDRQNLSQVEEEFYLARNRTTAREIIDSE